MLGPYWFSSQFEKPTGSTSLCFEIGVANSFWSVPVAQCDCVWEAVGVWNWRAFWYLPFCWNFYHFYTQRIGETTPRPRRIQFHTLLNPPNEPRYFKKAQRRNHDDSSRAVRFGSFRSGFGGTTFLHLGNSAVQNAVFTTLLLDKCITLRVDFTSFSIGGAPGFMTWELEMKYAIYWVGDLCVFLKRTWYHGIKFKRDWELGEGLSLWPCMDSC